MKKLEIISREIEIYKIKLLLFMAIAGGSWIYAFKIDEKIFIITLFFGFVISSYGIFSNILKLSDLQKELKGFRNG